MHPPDISLGLVCLIFILVFIFGTTVAYYKKDIAIFNMPRLDNFIQDFDKNYPQSNINLDTL